jgi:uncharacterized protein with HEPN domain
LPFRDARTHFEDILRSITAIEAFLKDFDFEAYLNDLKTRSAVERQLQIITEAAYRLGDDADALCPGIDWRGYMGMGNILRHAYHRTDDHMVWNTVTLDLPRLKVAVATAVGTIALIDPF